MMESNNLLFALSSRQTEILQAVLNQAALPCVKLFARLLPYIFLCWRNRCESISKMFDMVSAVQSG
jgi:hypothetical protein